MPVTRKPKRAIPGPTKKLDRDWLLARITAKFGTLTKLGEELDYDVSSLSGFMKGGRQLPVATVLRVAELLGVSLPVLLEKLGYETQGVGYAVRSRIIADGWVSDVSDLQGSTLWLPGTEPDLVAAHFDTEDAGPLAPYHGGHVPVPAQRDAGGATSSLWPSRGRQDGGSAASGLGRHRPGRR